MEQQKILNLKFLYSNPTLNIYIYRQSTERPTQFSQKFLGESLRRHVLVVE